MFKILLSITVLGVFCCQARTVQAQQTFATITYVDHNQVEPHPIKVQLAHGAVETASGDPFEGVRLAVFTERRHRLVANAESDARGIFSFPQLPSGHYRLVAVSPGFCSANIPIRITAGFMVVNHLDPGVNLRMKAGRADSCSSVSTH